MNVLIYFGNQINPRDGGTERVASLISDYLKRNGHTVYFMACEPSPAKDSVESEFLPDGVETPTANNVRFVNDFITRKRISAIINEGGYGDSIYLFSHNHIPQSVKILSHIHFDPVGGNRSFYKTLNLPLRGVDAKTFAGNLLRWIKAPCNRANFLKSKKNRFKELIRTSDNIVFLKESHARDFKIFSEATDSSKLVVIKNPITFDCANISETGKENTILFVGRLDYKAKRVDRILKVWKILQAKFNDWNLTIVGDGPDRNRLEQFCTRNNLKRVTFTGKTDASLYYRKAKLLLMTSNYEGCPMVIPEAMAYGVVPVVMNTFSGSDDIIINEHNGILTQPFDIKDMAAKVESLISNPAKLSEMSENAIKSIAEISNESILQNWLKAIS